MKFQAEPEYIYVKSGSSVGDGSFHLSVEGDCYINYENASYDRKKFPARKPFINPKLDLENRTFTG